GGFWLAKEYVEGPTGKEILESGRPFTAQQMRELETLYGQIRELARRHSVFIDFQPANVVWSAERGTWFGMSRSSSASADCAPWPSARSSRARAGACSR
ncbi:MAG: hypothetical protein ACK4N5_24890, partial [Myxococcales bacterium]